MATMCLRALEGSISIDEFYNKWPVDLCSSELAELIYEDLEDGIQHFPAKILSGKPDDESWKSSDMYRRILIASEILKLNLDESALKGIRHSLLSDTNLALDNVAAEAKKLSTRVRRINK